MRFSSLPHVIVQKMTHLPHWVGDGTSLSTRGAGVGAPPVGVPAPSTSNGVDSRGAEPWDPESLCLHSGSSLGCWRPHHWPFT